MHRTNLCGTSVREPVTRFAATFRIELALFAASAGLRLAALGIFGLPDANYYSEIASNILHEDTFARERGTFNTQIEPLYPTLLAVLRWIADDAPVLVVALQAMVAAVASPLLYRLTLVLSGDRSAAFMAGLLFASHPYLIRQAVAYQCLTVTALLLIWAALRFHAARVLGQGAAFGLVLGLLLLTRLSAAPIAVLAIIWLWRYGAAGTAFRATMVLLATITPWSVRNYAVDGTVGSSRIGENLYVSTAPISRVLLPNNDVDLVVPHIYGELEAGTGAELTSATMNSLLIARSFRYLLENPWDVLTVKLQNSAAVFSPRLLPRYPKHRGTVMEINGSHVTVIGQIERRRSYEIAFTLTMILTLPAALGGLWIRRQLVLQSDAFLISTLVSFAFVHAVFFPTTRLVSPMYFVLQFYAAIALSRGLRVAFTNVTFSGAGTSSRKRAFSNWPTGRRTAYSAVIRAAMRAPLFTAVAATPRVGSAMTAAVGNHFLDPTLCEGATALLPQQSFHCRTVLRPHAVELGRQESYLRRSRSRWLTTG